MITVYLKKGKRKGERCPEKFREDVGTLLLKEFILLGVLGLVTLQRNNSSNDQIE